MDTHAERRHFLRSVFHSPVRLSLGEHSSLGFLQDVSLKGALVETMPDWDGQVGDTCRLHLELGTDTVMEMETTVAHIEGTHAGLHCEHIDLDSMTHLRQLVELNAEDPALLERDLATLVAPGPAGH